MKFLIISSLILLLIALINGAPADDFADFDARLANVLKDINKPGNNLKKFSNSIIDLKGLITEDNIEVLSNVVQEQIDALQGDTFKNRLNTTLEVLPEEIKNFVLNKIPELDAKVLPKLKDREAELSKDLKTAKDKLLALSITMKSADADKKDSTEKQWQEFKESISNARTKYGDVYEELKPQLREIGFPLDSQRYWTINPFITIVLI